MLPSAEDLTEAVRRRPGRKTKELAEALGVDEGEFDAFVLLCLALQRGGRLVRVPRSGWSVPEDTDYRVGGIQFDRKGQGYVRVGADSIRERDIFVSREDVGSAFPGDTVLVELERTRGRRAAPTERLRSGRVIDVLERGRRLIRGRYREGDLVEPVGQRSAPAIQVEPEEGVAYQDGEEVLVQLRGTTAKGGRPRGQVIVRGREEGSRESDLRIVTEIFDLPGPQSGAVASAAALLPAIESGRDWPGRRDLRGECVFTIDPVDAKDFDDAVGLAVLADGAVRLDVHIADVSHYVPSGGVLDREAALRGTSIYLAGTVIPMLPERLSNELASLQPDVDRLAKTIRMEFGPRGELRGFEVFRSVIRSARRFTYEEVLAILEGPAARESPEAPAGGIEATILRMARLRDELRARREDRGGLFLDIPKLRLELDRDGAVIAVGVERHDPSHALIEEFMLAANECVGRYLVERGLPFVSRVHSPPDERRIKDFVAFLESLDIPFRGGARARDYQDLVRSLAQDPLRAVIELSLLRTMDHAEYQSGPGDHFALAASNYCHFTSPIRRYPDLLLHQVFDEVWDGRLSDASRRAEWAERLPVAAAESSALERRAEEAEREFSRLRLIRYLEGRIGERMDARVISVHPFGFFVRVDATLIDGLVHVAGLGDDYYEYDEEGRYLRGRTSKKTFRAGDAVRVELSAVDVDLREITFRFLRKLGEEEHERKVEARRKSRSGRRARD